MSNLPRTLTVRELIELLEDENPDAPVYFTADYGDMGRTQQLLPIRGKSEECGVERTAYSASGWGIIREEDVDLDDREEPEGQALVIS